MTAYTKDAKFTAFIRYQWTSNNQGNKLHRVVIFRDGGKWPAGAPVVYAGR